MCVNPHLKTNKYTTYFCFWVIFPKNHGVQLLLEISFFSFYFLNKTFCDPFLRFTYAVEVRRSWNKKHCWFWSFYMIHWKTLCSIISEYYLGFLNNEIIYSWQFFFFLRFEWIGCGREKLTGSEIQYWSIENGIKQCWFFSKYLLKKTEV